MGKRLAQSTCLRLRILVAALAVAVWGSVAEASISITVNAEVLKTSVGVPMTTNGLVILVASTTNNTFEGPTMDFFAVGDDVEVARWDLSLNGLDGILSDSASGVTFTNNWDAGDRLALFWFPTLTTITVSPGSNTEYGTYFDLTGIDGSDPWITPSDGGTVDLRFFTADATVLNTGGSNPAISGNALFNTPSIPEPASLSWLAFGLMGWALAGRRRSDT